MAPTRPSWRERIRLPTIQLPGFINAPWVQTTIRLGSWSYLALALFGVVLIWGLGDRWVLPTGLLYGPRWLFLVPGPPLLLITVLTAPRRALPVLAGLLLVLGPVMGGRTGWRQVLGGGNRELRVISFNMRGGENPMPGQVAAELIALRADVILLQECTSEVHDGARTFEPSGWHIRRDGGLCLVTRFPILESAAMETVETRGQGSTGSGMFYRLAGSGGADVEVVNLHLETPRKGLEPLRYQGSGRELARNILLRDSGSNRASRWAGSQGTDLVIAGDFNLVVESAIYRRHWSRCRNAFSRVGRGFGYTRVLRRFSARIDHVLSCGSWDPVAVELGPDLGSDHLPLIADFQRSGDRPVREDPDPIPES